MKAQLNIKIIQYFLKDQENTVALPNEVNLSGQDFEITLELDLKSVPKGHETLFSQSSILRLNEEFNDQSWKWSIITEECIFWIENVTSGYSNFVGGQSLRSGKLIIVMEILIVLFQNSHFHNMMKSQPLIMAF